MSTNLEQFLILHGFTREEYEKTELEWQTLLDVGEHHKATMAELRTAARYIAERLQEVPAVHSLNVRIKDPEHLIAKIIRKKIEKPELAIDITSYQASVTDLIGIRALHLFKEDWRSIHDFVTSTWDLAEAPTAYYREGDPHALLEAFQSAACDVKAHKFGYRSVHYLLTSQPAKTPRRAELQVRTIFEEGWSEIDHRLRYPRHSNSPLLANPLNILNNHRLKAVGLLGD